MTALGPQKPRAEDAIPDELVDAFFDHELGEGESDKFFTRLRANLPRCAEVAKMQRAISMLREPIEAPDVTDRVLSAVGRRRRFLPNRLMKMVTTGRLIAAGVALAAVLGIAIIDRTSPGFLRLTPASHPVGNVVSSTTEEARGVTHLAATAGTVRVLTNAANAPEAKQQSGGNRSVFMNLTPGVTSARVPGQGSGDDSLVVYRGAGPDTRFVLPEAVYIDKNAAIVLPLGHMSPSRVGARDWAGVSRDNLFLLPAVEPVTVSGAAAARKDKLDKAAKPDQKKEPPRDP